MGESADLASAPACVQTSCLALVIFYKNSNNHDVTGAVICTDLVPSFISFMFIEHLLCAVMHFSGKTGNKKDRTPALRELAFTAQTLSPMIPTVVGIGVGG